MLQVGLGISELLDQFVELDAAAKLSDTLAGRFQRGGKRFLAPGG